MSHPNPLHEYLHQVPLSNLVTKRYDTVLLSSQDAVDHSVKVLSQHKLLSAPVVDSKKNVVVGMVDMLDIVSFVLKVAPDPLSLKENELRSLEIAGRAMALEEVGHIVGASGRDPFVPVFEDNPVTMAVDLFAEGLHRAPVFDLSKRVVSTVSQSAVVQLLAQQIHMGKLKEMGQQKIDRFGLGLAAPLAVKRTNTVLQVLKSIGTANVSAVCLVDEDGKLAGTFSATDLKGLYTERWPHFVQPVAEFLEQYSPNSLNSVCCRRDSTLAEVVKELANSKVHRLWVVDDDFKPVGVVSTTDIMKVIRDANFP